jgi:hypothetical protein
MLAGHEAIHVIYREGDRQRPEIVILLHLLSAKEEEATALSVSPRFLHSFCAHYTIIITFLTRTNSQRYYCTKADFDSELLKECDASLCACVLFSCFL